MHFRRRWLLLLSLTAGCDHSDLVATRVQTASTAGSGGLGGGFGAGGSSGLTGAGASGSAAASGSSNGGTGTTGGAANGGTASGGAANGGSATGGASARGGAANGGSATTGGSAASGGAANGGSATGGSAASGGAASGGSATGGAGASGGAANGGSATTGGSASGGSAGVAGCPTLSFTSQTLATFGGIPASIGLGDLDGDKLPDLVVTDQSSFVGIALPWFHADGAGAFAAVQFLTTPYMLSDYTLALADLNADGKLDLAVSDNGNTSQPGGVQVFLNNGDATFAGPVLYDSNGPPSSIAIADFDGKGGPDMAVAVYNGVWVFTNPGDGTFGGKVAYTVGSSALSVPSVAVGDFNGDGHLDFAVAKPVGMGVFFNNGDGTFGAQNSYVAGAGAPNVENPKSIAVADLNHDGAPDIVVASFGTNTASIGVFMNDGSGNFAAQVRYPTSGNTHGATVASGDLRVAIGDLNADSHLDLAVPNFGGNSVGIFMGVGDGTFGVEAPSPAGFLPGAIAIGDVNGDGRPDLEIATNNPSNGQGVIQVLTATCQ
ncbi:MAG TPA: VCBS repeat-containing protein [Polyangiaceae bacterium]|jgi:hypothetical protein|nr:VCBS repeat-containing protein [Polyangiaceae bacterium]